MARRKDLKNIASGLAGTFVSRNNDIDGYWGIGKLCLLAQQSGQHQVRLGLWPMMALTPAHPPLHGALASLHTLRARLEQNLERQGIPKQWITSVSLNLVFSTADVPDTPYRRGKPFSLTVSILDDQSRNHVVTCGGFCAPHHPRREARSTRV